jgi:predicted P-loop ATPase
MQRLVPNVATALHALRRAPDLRDAFAYDQMALTPLLTRALPAGDGAPEPGDTYPRELRDTDVTRLQEFLQWNGLPKISAETLHQAIGLRAREKAFHPVRDYVESLKWDCTPRLGAWLHRYLGAEAGDYATAIGRMFLVAMVARAFQPGCKADYVLVLEAPQGAGKSSACRVLAGEQWFTDNLPPIDSKDASHHLRGKWLIEIAELSATRKADTEALKAFISRQEEQYRPAYGRATVVEPRQCVFIGTTNESAYLRDETGARRFWPLKVGAIDLAGLQRDRDQLFAEAMTLYRSGAKWWPDATFERKHIAGEQEARFETDVWQDAIAGYVEDKPRVRIMDIAKEALNFETSARVGTADQRRIGRVLTHLGWWQPPGKRSAQRFYVPRG